MMGRLEPLTVGLLIVQNYKISDEEHREYKQRVAAGEHRQTVRTKVFKGKSCIDQMFRWLAKKEKWLGDLNNPDVSFLKIKN